MLQDTLNIDEKDLLILTRFMKQSESSQSEIAQSLNMSQPSVNARIQKLKKRGLLATTTGIELGKTDMVLARVDFTASHAEKILNKLRNCSFFVNGFIMSGKNNISIMIVGYDLKRIEQILDRHLRANPDIKDINMSVVVSTAKPLVCALDLEKEHEECEDPTACATCVLSPIQLKK